MKYIFIFIPLFLFSCNNGPANPLKDTDSIDGMTIRERTDKFMDSIKVVSDKNVKNTILSHDTAGMSTAPVRDIKATIVKNEYSSYRDIKLIYKNFSNKKVSAIRFRWYGVNSFNEPADMGYSGVLLGIGGGFTDNPIGPGKTDDGEWSITSRDAKKVVAAWVTEVAFADGTTWKNKAN